MKKITLLLLLCGVICGCGSRQAQTSANLESQRKADSLALKVALMPTLDCLPFYYAEKCGLFKAAGLDVRLQTFKAQMDCDTSFARRHTDVCYTDLIRAALLQSKGTGLYIFMQADGHHELVTAKSKRIRQTRHLKERMVAMARHSVTDLLLDTVIAQAGLDPSTVYHPQINDIALRCDMLRNATIDAAFLPEPYATQARAAGHKSIYSSQKQQIQLMTFIATSKAMGDKRKKQQIELLVKGYNQAVRAINQKSEPDSITHILNSYPLETATIDTLKLPQFKQAHPFDNQQVATAIRFLRKRALITNQYKGDTLISTLFIK